MADVESIIHQILLIVLWPFIQIGLIITDIIFGGPNIPQPPIREDFLTNSATEIAEKIRKQKITSVEVVKACINRIEEINPITNCVIANRFREALAEAEAVDALIAEGSKSEEELATEKPFLGVPFSTKDGIAVKGMVQSSGMVCRKEKTAEKDADTIRRLRSAGGIPIATTNVPEMMMWWDSENKLYGRTKNPYHSEHIVGGSSGGEAALLASTGSFMGIGSDLGGSVRIPSFMCGIFGHFPSPGLVSPEGHYPPNPPNYMGMQSLGPMSRSAKDLKPILKVLSKGSSIDVKLDEPVDVKKLRYYYMDDNNGNPLVTGVDNTHPDIKKMMQSITDYFSSRYGITMIKVNIEEFKFAEDLWWVKGVKEDDSAMRIADALKDGQGTTNLPLEIVKAIFGCSEHTPASLIISSKELIVPKNGSAEHKKRAKRLQKLEQTLKALLRDDGVFLYPTQPTPPLKHMQSLLRPKNFAYTCVFNCARMTATQCPITQTKKGLPIGVQVAATPNNDRLTLAVAEELERAFGGWKKPPSQ